jgi:N-carbamoylputrescine amidase
MKRATDVTVAAAQMACTPDRQENLARAEETVRRAADQGADIILLQELFESQYFCQVEDPQFFELAREVDKSPAVRCFSALARELNVVIPVSFFERCNQVCYNTVAVMDADGRNLGCYRKTHIPDGPGYEEKFYFTPGDTGFRVWHTRRGVIGVGICWDQWFPETARAMALMGAEVLFFPTAIGSEPENPGLDSRSHWQRCMQGHAAANMVPVVAANRIGKEAFGDTSITFYGSSFITDNHGEILAQAGRSDPEIITARLDLAAMADERRAWGLFRDRRPSAYGVLMTKDGHLKMEANQNRPGD